MLSNFVLSGIDFTQASEFEMVNIVARFVEVMGNQGIFMFANTINVFIDSDVEFALCFTDIQFVAFITDNGINNIACFTC